MVQQPRAAGAAGVGDHGVIGQKCVARQIANEQWQKSTPLPPASGARPGGQPEFRARRPTLAISGEFSVTLQEGARAPRMFTAAQRQR